MRIAPSMIAKGAFNITPNASPLPIRAYGIKCTGAGTVTYTGLDGNSITETVTAGERIPVIITHVTAATATGLIGYNRLDANKN